MMEIIISILSHSWLLTLEMAPYLLLGFFAAGILHVFIPTDMIGKHLGSESLLSIVKASLFGVPIPLCSCGVLPVAAGLRKSGAGKSATLSFLITTPVTGVDSLMATWALLGSIFTLLRLATSLLIGFAAGIIMALFSNKETEINLNNNLCNNNSNCYSNDENSKLKKRNITATSKELLEYAFIELPASFSGSLLFGLLLAGTISFLLPPELIKEHFGSGIIGIIIATAVAIPLYVCATGSIPIAAAMIIAGFSPGAALAFLIAGPATNSVAFITVKDLLGKKALIIYLIVIFTGAVGFGYTLDIFNIKLNIDQSTMMMNSKDSYLKLISAGILLVIIIPLYIKELISKYINKNKLKENLSMKGLLLNVPEISCSHCANTIKKSLSKFNEIDEIIVDIDEKQVKLNFIEKINDEKILSALEEAGYPAEIIDIIK